MPAKRGRPSFKPPRPAASKSTKSKATPRRKSAPAATIVSSSASEHDASSLANDTSSESDINSSMTVAGPSFTQDPPPAIPPKLLTRVLHHHFEKKDHGVTKMGKDANMLVGKYVETFVREAIARAAFERSQADAEAGMGDGFLEVGARNIRLNKTQRHINANEELQVEDLEKLAPQLLLDF
ncbi:MAG: hypothetical protein LQ338_005737 [Usnochroma carphineum]|nr:MAG: hypothetical protein LQ338_005737 [Usnochroma carphineum]